MLFNIPNKSEFYVLLQSLIEQNKSNNKSLTYCGIGSEDTPIDIIKKMSYISKRLEHQWFVLLTGGAEGADTAFVAGTQHYKIFLPNRIWLTRTANGKDVINSPTLNNWNIALSTVSKYHPNPSALSLFGTNLMARNAYCVLNEDLQSPVDFVLCWTPNDKDVGGTSQGIRIARDYNIPIFNLADEKVFNDVLITLKLDF